MRILALILILLIGPFSIAKDAKLNRIVKKNIAMNQKKQKVTLASALHIDRPTPMTSDVLTEGAYEGMGTVGNVPGVLAK